jgi:hypothetical protein
MSEDLTIYKRAREIKPGGIDPARSVFVDEAVRRYRARAGQRVARRPAKPMRQSRRR